jgi:HSP20 family protein
MSWLTPWRGGSTLPAEFRPLDQWMREFEHSMRDFFGNGHGALAETRLLCPRADVAETDKEYLISLELPGLDESEIDVKLTGDELIVTGEKKQKKEEKGKHFLRTETYHGAFERRFELPTGVRKEPDSLKATFRNGVLEVRVLKTEPRPVAKIPVKSV